MSVREEDGQDAGCGRRMDGKCIRSPRATAQSRQLNPLRLTGKRRCLRLAGWILLFLLLPGQALAVPPTSDEPVQLLKQADALKTSNPAEFDATMQRLVSEPAKLSSEQKLYLRYLQGFRLGYGGEYAAAIQSLNEVARQSTNPVLRFRAGVTVVNLLEIGTRYEQAFSRLNDLLEQLPQVTDKDARKQVMAIASQLYGEVGQYDLSTTYADRMLKEQPTGANVCRAGMLILQSLYKRGEMLPTNPRFQMGIEACVAAKEPIFTNSVRSFVADFYLQQGRPEAAIDLLQQNHAEVAATHYPRLISAWDSLLAEAYWKQGDAKRAQQFAEAALKGSVKNEYTVPLSTACRLLYLIARKQGDMGAALAYHERYMAADKGYLDGISAKTLAYQIVKQQVLGKKLQVDTLNKQNQILMLQEELDEKAVESRRLYIVALMLALGFIALWTYRLKRSQLLFMTQARCDSLTGILNRQHFLSAAAQQLQHCRRSAVEAGLVLIDLDYFKQVNDVHGHAIGDDVLQRVVEACRDHLRSTDIFGRLGGEEFGILFPECALGQVIARAEQLRLAIVSVSDDIAADILISGSFGVATTTRSGYALQQLLLHVDDALYRSKREGRNRVSVADASQPTLRMV